ncbi:MAG: hypothetical protein K2P64_06745, partial [Lachnospiraceae bacterium]|nr:hypothetical protein [Lachnospiraceae bacterium]
MTGIHIYKANGRKSFGRAVIIALSRAHTKPSVELSNLYRLYEALKVNTEKDRVMIIIHITTGI